MKKVMVVIPALGSGGGERLAVSLIAKMDPQIIKTKLVVLPTRESDLVVVETLAQRARKARL